MTQIGKYVNIWEHMPQFGELFVSKPNRTCLSLPQVVVNGGSTETERLGAFPAPRGYPTLQRLEIHVELWISLDITP